MATDVSAELGRRMAEKGEKAKAANDELNATLVELGRTLADVRDALSAPPEANTLLLCQAPVEPFFAEEDEFRDALTKFARTLFAETLGADPPVSSDHSLLLRGLPHQSERFRRLQAESLRLVDASRVGREAEVAAEVSRARARAQAEELRAALQRLRSGAAVDPAASVRRCALSEQEHRAIVSRVHTLRSHVERIRRCEIPALLDDVCAGLGVRVESAQLRLQEARHRFFVHRQELLISWLLRQRRMGTLLLMLHEAERRGQKLLLRALQRAEEARDALEAGTRPPQLEGRCDLRMPSLEGPRVRAALAALDADRRAPSSVSRWAVAVAGRENAELRREMREFDAALGGLLARVLPDGPASEPQLSYPEVRRVLAETRAQVKALTQRAAQFARHPLPAPAPVQS